MKRLGRVERSVSASLSVFSEIPNSERTDGVRFEVMNSCIPFCSGFSCFLFGGRVLDPACLGLPRVGFWCCSSVCMSIFVYFL